MPEIESNKFNTAKGVVQQVIKEKGIEGQKANVVLVLDYSLSMSTLYSNGFVQQVVERVVPVSMAFDDDGEVEVYIFNDSAFRILPPASESNIKGYVKDHIMSKYSYGYTQYAPAINMIVKKFTKDNGAEEVESIGAKISGWFGGAKKSTLKQVTSDLPTYVIFITDGENSDKAACQEAIVDAAKHGIFFQFIGLKSSYSDKFAFLTKLDKMEGRFIDNANFFELTDKQMVLDPAHPEKYLKDEDLYAKLLVEFPSWVGEAKTKQLIKS